MKIGKRSVIIILILLLTPVAIFFAFSVLRVQKPPVRKEKVSYPFYVYSDYGASDRLHFTPSGRMGDILTLRMWGNCRFEPYAGQSCIKVVYDPARETLGPYDAFNKWAGIIWNYPPNNWGNFPNQGYDLGRAKKLVFFAKGEKGGETVEFFMGGITGRYGDSGKTDKIEMELSSDWTRCEIPLSKVNMKYIIGGFGLAVSGEANPEGAVFYLDEIYYAD